jgi:hypothetical protein
MPQKKKRIRNPLELNNRDFVHMRRKDKVVGGATSKYDPLTLDVSEEKVKARGDRARKMHATNALKKIKPSNPCVLLPPIASSTPLATLGTSHPSLSPSNRAIKLPGFYKSRDHGIRYMFQLFGSPQRDEWADMKLVPEIMKHLLKRDRKDTLTSAPIHDDALQGFEELLSLNVNSYNCVMDFYEDEAEKDLEHEARRLYDKNVLAHASDDESGEEDSDDVNGVEDEED